MPTAARPTGPSMPGAGVAEGAPSSEVIVIEPMTDPHGPAVLDIYGQGIASGVATFETVVPEWRAWHAAHRRDCRFVARLGGAVVGWTALGRYSSREVYAGVMWESVYVDAAARGRGVGR